MAQSTATTNRSADKSAAKKKKAVKKAAAKTKAKIALTAKKADKHVLYQLSVQAPATDSKVYARWFKKYTGRDLRAWREDFCGTSVLSCHHVLNHKENTAVGVDFHRPTLVWGINNNVNDRSAGIFFGRR